MYVAVTGQYYDYGTSRSHDDCFTWLLIFALVVLSLVRDGECTDSAAPSAKGHDPDHLNGTL